MSTGTAPPLFLARGEPTPSSPAATSVRHKSVTKSAKSVTSCARAHRFTCSDGLFCSPSEKCEEEPSRDIPAAMGRHFYDVYMLLGSKPVLFFLEDRDQFVDVVKDCERVSREYFKSDYLRPDGGYATGTAFQASDRMMSQLQAALADAEDLYFGTASYPTWDQVIDRMRTHSDLL
jgi:hypothetical protein